jgi:trigger factor
LFFEDAVNELFPQAYLDAMDEGGIEPVGRPEVDILSVDKAAGFTFKVVVTVKPEVKLGEYKGIAGVKNIYTVEEADIDTEIEALRERNARLVTAEDREAQNGDEATIDFKGFVDDVPFAGGEAEGHKITLGSHSFIDTFEQQIEGHKPGDEFDVNVTFPAEYHAPELAGKPALFKVKLHALQYKELPELDDEFVKDVSEFDTLEELREDLKKRSAENLEARAKDELENSLLDAVTDTLEADIPDVMVETRIDELVRDFDYRLQRQGMELKLYLQYAGKDETSFRADFKEQAERQVRMRLALETIAKLEELEVTAEDVEAEYERIAKNYGVNAGRMREIVAEKELRADLATTKAIDFVRENAVITEKPFVKDEPAEAEAEDNAEDKEEKKPAKKPAKPRAKKPKAEPEAEAKEE